MPVTVPVMRGGASFCTAFGDSRLVDVQPIAAQQWGVAELAASGYAPATTHKAYEIARGATLTRDPGRYPDGTH